MENNPNISVPNSMTKKQLFSAFYPTPERLLRSSINQIILDSRKKHNRNKHKSDFELINSKTVLKDEIIELTKEFGTPKCFEVKEK